MIKALYFKYKEMILYLIFGVLTTLVNIVAFWLADLLLGSKLYLFNNFLAWVVAVIFAFITNKLFVFESKSFSVKLLVKEAMSFTAARVFSFLIEEGGMWLFVDWLNFSEYSVTFLGFTIDGQLMAKIILSVIVVLLNYVFSKWFIFKNKPVAD